MAQQANWLVPPPGANAVGTAAAAEGTIFQSTTYPAATYNSVEISNPAAKGVRLFINITNANGSSVLLSIQSKDPVSGNWISIPDGATTGALTSNGTYTLTVYPGIAETAAGANASTEISDHLDLSWRAVLVVSAATVTLSVGGTYLS